MCRTCGKRHNSLIQDGSPGAVTQDAGSLGSSGSGSIPLSWGVRSPGKVSPLRGRTMKEYEEQLAALKKENFALKLRIYFLEESVDKKGQKEDKEQLYRTNIELKVETEALKQEVYDKQQLVREASLALASLDQQYQSQLEAATHLHHQETIQLQATIAALQKEVEEYAERAMQTDRDGIRMGELTQLCGLAFPSDESNDDDGNLDLSFWGQQEDKDGRKNKYEDKGRGLLNAWNNQLAQKESTLWGDDGLRSNTKSHPCTIPTPASVPSLLPQTVNPVVSVYGGGLSSPSSMQGLFSLSKPTTAAHPSTPPANNMAPSPSSLPQEEVEIMGRLKERIKELEERVQELKTHLEEKEEMKCVLEGDLENLKKEVEEKVERVTELEVEVAEREERLEDVMQELETRHSQLRDKDHQISSLHNDLNKVQPEMEVKVQEIVERDRIIEEKIEKIEQQNKILVEIQITLDERQKQLADAETRLAETEAKLVKAEARADEATMKEEKVTRDFNKSCEVIKGFGEEVHTRDKEIARLRKEVIRKEKKIRDLVAELKETLDMLSKAKWEAETSGGEDGVKEMAEEENEVRMTEIVSVTTDNVRSEDVKRAEYICETIDNQVKGTEYMGGNSECMGHWRAENKATVEACWEQEWNRENERWRLHSDTKYVMGMECSDEEKNQSGTAENSDDGGGSGGRYNHWASRTGSREQLSKGERGFEKYRQRKGMEENGMKEVKYKRNVDLRERKEHEILMMRQRREEESRGITTRNIQTRRNTVDQNLGGASIRVRELGGRGRRGIKDEERERVEERAEGMNLNESKDSNWSPKFNAEIENARNAVTSYNNEERGRRERTLESERVLEQRKRKSLEYRERMRVLERELTLDIREVERNVEYLEREKMKLERDEREKYITTRRGVKSQEMAGDSNGRYAPLFGKSDYKGMNRQGTSINKKEEDWELPISLSISHPSRELQNASPSHDSYFSMYSRHSPNPHINIIVPSPPPNSPQSPVSSTLLHRLWAEVEARKKELLSVRTAAEAAVAAAEERAQGLAEEVANLTALRDQQTKDLASQQEQLLTLQSQLQQVQAETSGREGQLAAAEAQVKGLEAQLVDTRTQLDQKRKRLAELEDNLRATTAGELDRQALQVDRLQGHLAALAANSNTSDQHLGAAGETREGQQARSDTSGTVTARVDIVAMTQPVPVSVGEDSVGTVHHLYQEVSRLRTEADALREERSHLNQQLTSLYNTYSHTTPNLTSCSTSSTTLQNTTPAKHSITLIPQITTQTPCLASSTDNVATPAPHITSSANPVTTLTNCLDTPAYCPTTIASPLTTTAPETTITLDHTCSVTTSKDRTHTTPSSTSNDTLCSVSLCVKEVVDVKKDEEQKQEEERQQEAAVGQACQEQVEALKAELEEAQRVGEELGRVGESQSQRHKVEIAWLRRRLAESHTACDLLRTRLEELADFLEAILDLEGRGIITLDALPPSQLAALHNSLDQSRALSRSLSQSLMIGVNAGEETGLATSLNDLSTWAGHELFLPTAPCLAEDSTMALNASTTLSHDTVGLDENTTLGLTMTGYNQTTTTNLTQNTTAVLSENMSMDAGLDTTMGQGQEKRAKMVQALAARLTARLDQKTLELDAIADSVSDLTQRLATRTNQVTHQAGVIGELKATVGQLTAQLAAQDSGHSSDPLPPPPLHLLRDSDCETEADTEHVGLRSEPSSLGAIKSAYSTDVAIKAHSGRLAQQQLHQTGPGESGVGVGDQWVASLSESEAWSEPDRNVSLARIGLDATTLAATPDRAPPRPRQTRTITLTSESEGEVPQDDPSTSAPTKTTKRRSDVAELRRVSSRLRAVEQLNDTLRTELHLYHSLTHHLQPPQHQTSATPNTTSTIDTIDIQTTPAVTNTAVPVVTTTATTSTMVEGEVALVAAPLLAEVRGLRSTLEEAITNNDHLRDQLEAALSAHPHEEARFLHLTAALLTAQEEVREARERSSVAQGQVEEARAMADESDKAAEQARKEAMQARTKLEEIMKEASEIKTKADQAKLEVDETKHMAEEAKAEAEQVKKELENTRTETRLEMNRVMDKTKEARLEAEEAKLKLKQTLEAAEAKQEELEAEVRQMVARITSLKEKVQQLEAEVVKREKQVKEEVTKREKQAEEERQRLEEKEQRLLKVNKERLALVGERARLHARFTTQAEDRRRVEVEMEQLAEDKKRLRLEKEESEEDRKRLMEENKLIENERKKLMEENERMECDKKTLVEAERERGKSVELELEGLRGELEAERRVTETLQQRLEELRTLHSPDSSDHSVVLPATSDASQESVTSMEYIPYSASHHLSLWRCGQSLSPTTTPTPTSPTPLPPPPHHQREKDLGNTGILSINKHDREAISSRRERDNKITRRDRDSNRWERERSSSNKREKDTNNSRRERDSSTNKRNHSSSDSSLWLENKENLFISTTTTTTTTNNTFSGKRGRKTIEGGSGNSGILALSSSPNLIQEDEDVDIDVYGGPGEYDDGETSGESPDLGICSDHHYSSLERGTTMSALAANYHHTYSSSGHNVLPHQPPSLPTQLCSEPSHSVINKENKRLRTERDNLAARLSTTLVTLKDAHEKLSQANQRKATVERAISNWQPAVKTCTKSSALYSWIRLGICVYFVWGRLPSSTCDW
ncbi:hypothetical protein Pmani_027845 [Petrolisthes manimaculis]|uniref:Centrosomin N-terminal motif 1 domain-containing protein n=1 Tax=Petrolisthes manimaculis TaxID=1843537 RepID=A0AAE1P1A2_9EUCA|nr:hypothetical protein Pmani_027845 [Petrolisthes manimaculis]